jgi:GntR family transcriptional regulator
LITRRRAIGTTVNRHVSPQALAIQRLVGFEQLLLQGSSSGGEVTVEDARWDRGVAPEVFIAEFGLSRTDQFILCDKKYVLNGRVALWVRDAIPVSNLKHDDVDPADLPSSLLAFVDNFCRAPIDHAVAHMSAIVSTERGNAQTALALAVGGAFMRLRERFYAADATVVGYGILDIDDAVAKIEIYRRRY